MKLFDQLKAIFSNTPERIEKEFDRAILRIREGLADVDNDGTPDALARLMRNVATAVNLLEVIYPASGRIKRGGEKLSRFAAKLEVNNQKWLIAKYLIEGAVSLRNLSK